jgi:hypothetical protein
VTDREDDAKVFDPREEADAQMLRILQIMEGARDWHLNEARPYTTEELDTMLFSLNMALVQLKKVPGGREAMDRHFARCEDELRRRGREDLVQDADVDNKVTKVIHAVTDLRAALEDPTPSASSHRSRTDSLRRLIDAEIYIKRGLRSVP